MKPSTAMLLNEFLKEHRIVQEQREYFESKLATQQKQIEALSAAVQKVRDKLELQEGTAHPPAGE